MNTKIEQKVALSKWLARAGVASRRESTKIITAGLVAVNGKIIKAPFFRIDESLDVIEYHGKIVRANTTKHYYLINKPIGVVSSTTGEQGSHQAVTDLLPKSDRLYPVGRLDRASEGLLILTNDGDVAYRLTHPKFQVEKTYHVLVSGELNPHKIIRLTAGVMLKGIKTNPATVKILEKQGNATWLEIIISQGRFHQIRRMCSAVFLQVERLVRTKEGELELGDLPVGKWRKLSPSEVDHLKQIMLPEP